MLFPALKITFRAERRYEMAYVTVPKDLTKIKSKVMFNLTKRQLVCFSAAVAIGLPLFFLVKGSVGTSAAALCMVLAMLPMFLLAGNVLMDCTMDEGEPEYTVSYRYYEQTGYFQKKYININSYNEGKIEPFGKQMFPGISSQTSQQLLQIADLIHIRFADVLLMQSELKQDATGLNKVRARSHLAPVAYSLEAIKQERRWELAFESIRWWDILRWSGPSLEEAGDILNKQTGFNIINAATVVPMVKFDYKKRLQATQGYWPIPQDEIDISNGVLEQNPGWDASAQFSDWNNM